MGARTPCRFVGFSPGEYVVVGLSYKSAIIQTDMDKVVEIRFKIGDIKKPINFIPALHMNEQNVIN
jgi:hypothetical protein